MAPGDVLEEKILPRASDASQQSNEEGKHGAHASPPHLGGGSAGGRSGAISDTIRVLWSYNHRIAEVAEALSAPADSESGPNWFFRGIAGVNAKLRSRWGSRCGYYLGEWHYHPAGEAAPSRTDRIQISSIAKSEKYACPEPVLIVIGGTPRRFGIRSYVFPADEGCHEFTCC